jgi:hypothetical protein
MGRLQFREREGAQQRHDVLAAEFVIYRSCDRGETWPSCARSTYRGRLPGHSPGRTRGARNRLAEEVFRDAHAHWCEIEASSGRRKGEIALELLFRERPGDYCRLVANILPKEFTNNAVELDLADDELDELIAAAASRE